MKRILRFYYSADSLERAFDNLIERIACSSVYNSCLKGAQRLCDVICEKSELADLWSYLDGIIPKMSDEEQSSLKEYASLRCGIRKLEEERVKRLRRAVIKFVRRARRLESFTKGVALVGKYYCLLVPS